LTDVGSPMLSVEGLVAGYGKRVVVKSATVYVGSGEVVALIGHNGSGKSTLLRTVFGFLPVLDGAVQIQGIANRVPPWKMLENGVAYVPQGGKVFADMTVAENLRIGAMAEVRPREWQENLDRIGRLFPTILRRLNQRARTLSGGEKQMLALANVLLLRPKLLLVDEPSLGLSPSLVRETLARIRDVATSFGTAVLIVEQRVSEVLRIADRVYVLRDGEVTFSGAAKTLDDVTLREVYL
jgi:branched-chain amino acid transport system ATP-binding protein